MRSRIRAATILMAVFAVSLGVPAPAGAAPSPCPAIPTVTERCPAWIGSYNNPNGRGGTGDDVYRSAALSPAGDRLFVGGTSYDDVTSYDGLVAAFDTMTGNVVWSSRYDGPMRGYDTASAVTVSPDGSTVYSTGRSQGPDGDWDFATIAYDAATGVQRWVARYDGPQHMDDRSFGIAVSPDGGTVFAGGTRDDELNNADAGDYGVVAYDAATGEERWAAGYQGTAGQYDIVDKLLISRDGSRLYATGRSYGAGTGPDAVTVAFDTTDGDELWAARYNGVGTGTDEGIDLAQSADGSRLVVVAPSASSSTGTNDWATVLYDTSSGAQLWATRYNGGANGADTVSAVAVCGARAFVTGSSAETGTGQDFRVAAYDLTTGAQVWQTTYATPGNWTDVPRGISASPSCDRLFVTGNSLYPRAEFQPFEHLEYGSYLTTALSAADGSRSWVSRYNSSGYGDDVSFAALVSPDARTVYVAGTFVYNGAYSLQLGTPPPYSFDFGVVAYAAT
ncbi:MAG: PQQ-binding-like beta-propeller repeat protein [Actinomycetota bacterium]